MPMSTTSPSASFVGLVIVVDEHGFSFFDLPRCRHYDRVAVLFAFDLIEVGGDDLRSMPIEQRNDVLAKLLGHPLKGIASTKIIPPLPPSY